MQYPIFPWTIVDFDSEKLDFKNPTIFRNLSLTMGALGNPERVG